jgi:hypothetical protein
MLRKKGLLFCFLGASLSLLAAAAQARPASEILKPLKVITAPVIDGNLDEPVWAEAPSVTGFKTFIPDFGRDISENTVAYMAYDSENLYFAFQCFDREPDKIKASISRRDDIHSDDFVCINLDSFNDQQSLYAFYVNPLGIQMDSRFASGIEDFSADFVWYSAGRIHGQGYSVEIRIPLKSIRYSSGDRIEMGNIFERSISRRTEHGSYPPLDPKRGYAFLTQMAPMEYSGLKKYTLLEILPGFTYSQRYMLDEGRLRREKAARDLSLTGKYGLTPSLILDGTYNPDFSQVEADAGQVDVNLRYDLFFPEKRPFFLEGSENFNLAGTTDQDYLLAAVHTRNIIDPKAGVKLTGKLARKDNLATIFASDEGAAASDSLPAGEDLAYFSVLRYKHALSQDSFLGFFFTNRDRPGRHNRVLGPDGQVRLTQSSQLSFHALSSFTRESGDSLKETGHALGLDYLYDTSSWEIRCGLQDISTDFETDTGYLTRTGLTRLRGSVTPKFYPRSRVLRRVDLSFSSSQLKDQSSDLWETGNTLSLGFLLVRSSRLLVGYTYSTEVFLGQRFQTSGWNIQAQSQITKRFYFRVLFRDGQAIRYEEVPFQGKGKRATATLTYQPSEKINWTLDLTYSDLFRDSTSEKVYDYTILRNRLTYQMNKYLFFRGVVEYNSYRKQILTDFLASFTYIPGTVLHLGYGSLFHKIRWQGDDYVDSDRFLEARRGLFFKASYLWRL